jgi:hypothetical protein
MTANLFTIDAQRWEEPPAPGLADQAIAALESGHVLFLPKLRFDLQPAELGFLNPDTVHGSKNVSYSPATGRVGGTQAQGAELDALRELLSRFSRATLRLAGDLLPRYRTALRQGRTSLRPVEVAGRVSSWRADDTRLHVDTFPSTPTRGHRILRVFSNINHAGQPRVWRVGEPFDAVARRFAPSLRAPLWGSRAALYAVRVTKSMRTPYDHYMLQLHDRMKADSRYQAESEQFTCSFPAGSTWMAYTDQVPHAALSGIHQLEQTFYLPVSALRDEASAPLRVLERELGRRLA